MKYHALNDRILEQRRELVRLWKDWISGEDRRRHGYLGTMGWARRSGEQRLYRRVATSEHCLGPRSRETEAILRSFQYGRGRLEKRLLVLTEEMAAAASRLRGLGDGVIGPGQAGLLRQLRIHGKALGAMVIDTTAHEAYAALAGVALQGRVPAMPKGPQLELLVDDSQQDELLAVLRQHVDSSLQVGERADVRRIVVGGLTVDLCRPFGSLQWLANAPKLEIVVPDRRGFPVPVRCADPRHWIAYRLWAAHASGRRDATAHMLLDALLSHLPEYPIDEACLSRMPGQLGHRLRAEAFPGAHWPGTSQPA